MADEVQDRLRSVIARLLGVPADQVTPDLKMGGHPRWDSMGHMNLVASVEKAFGIRFPSHALARITSVELINKELSKALDQR